jgi:hypothetical protein
MDSLPGRRRRRHRIARRAGQTQRALRSRRRPCGLGAPVSRLQRGWRSASGRLRFLAWADRCGRSPTQPPAVAGQRRPSRPPSTARSRVSATATLGDRRRGLAWQDGRSKPSVAKRIGARLVPATTSAPRAAPGPRSAGGETDPPGRTPTTARGAGRHKF